MIVKSGYLVRAVSGRHWQIARETSSSNSLHSSLQHMTVLGQPKPTYPIWVCGGLLSQSEAVTVGHSMSHGRGRVESSIGSQWQALHLQI